MIIYITSVNPVHNATVVVNATRRGWPDVNKKKKDKKRSKYVALDFSEKTNPKKKWKKKQIHSLRFFCPFYILYFIFCFFIFVNLREGEKNPKKQIQKKKDKKEANT